MSMVIDKTFDTRIKRVRRNHMRMARGYDAKVGRDGLIVFRPRRRKASFRFRSLFLLVAAFLAFKVVVLMQIGVDAYQLRIDRLEAGTAVEQVGAYAMQIDPVTRAVVTGLAPLF